MKRLLLVINLSLLFGVLAAFGQKGDVVEKQIKFAKGSKSAMVKGLVRDRLDSHIFHIQAKAGQTLSVKMISSRPLRDANLCVNYPLNDAGRNEGVCGKRQYKIKLPRSGDYEIYIEAIRDAIPYTIKISIN
jgi:hypothetical protein